MSRQHWIDEFFRKRMEHREFPVEEGEYEEVRALLEKRNNTGAAVRGGFSKWWLSALIPMAGLLWWAVEGGAGEDAANSTLASEHPAATERNDRRQDAQWAANTSAPVEVHPMSATAGGGSAVGVVAASLMERASPVDRADMVSQAERNGRRDHAIASRQPGSGDVMGTHDKASVNAQEGDQDQAARSIRHEARSHSGSISPEAAEQQETAGSLASEDAFDRTGLIAPAEDHHEAALSLRLAGGPEQADRNTEGGDPDDATVAELRNVPVDRADVGAVAWMLPRRSLPRIADAPQPVQLEMPVFKRLAMGELHVFGAPMTVRTKSSGGDHSGGEAGSRFGLEYRVRAKRLSWATGIHYGSYALQADLGAADVRLGFVEVPLLAGYGLGLGRFGLLLQGGMSVDLLFNSTGRYSVEVDRTSAGFPDDAFSTLNVSWLLRPQVSYQCSEHLGVSMGPLWKAQLGEVAKEGPLEGARVSSTGLSIGLTWRLERTTF